MTMWNKDDQFGNFIYIDLKYYDNGNEGTCCNFTSMFQTMFSSMFSSMFPRDRGFIFFRTSMIQVCCQKNSQIYF